MIKKEHTFRKHICSKMYAAYTMLGSKKIRISYNFQFCTRMWLHRIYLDYCVWTPYKKCDIETLKGYKYWQLKYDQKLAI